MYRGGISRQTRVEYVNRAGQRVNPRTGKPLRGYGGGGGFGIQSRLGGRGRNGINKPIIKKKRPLPVKRIGTLFGNLEPIPTNPRIDPPPRVCYNCWQPGHPKRSCPRPCVARFCANCGRRDEDVETCPRCCQRHKLWLESGQQRDEVDETDLDQHAEYHNWQHEEDNTEEDACDIVLREVMRRNEQQEAMRQRELQEMEFRRMREIESLRRVQEFDSQQIFMRRQRIKDEPHFQVSEVGSFNPRPDSPNYNNIMGASGMGNSYNGESVSFNGDEDPVNDVLKLAQTISHLSPMTQDMIMRQVMAERREKRQVEESWV
ncbi:unnamed protein product [Trichogramma brassicae]|uniref:CCHC-type domain-containing protein n=1 Tax=Trichogramma brassicae TaxID=86971 RepID=A0A6H5I6J7_9HYME|nr:unnamed protein product [Trichogramma brassicae]